MPNWIRMFITLVGVICLAIFISWIIVTWADVANSGSIDACTRLGGQITGRGWICELPNGLIVEPIKWEKNQ